jgi:hypothetical protein
VSLKQATIEARAAWLPKVEVSTERWRTWRAGEYIRSGERTAIVDLEQLDRDKAFDAFRDASMVCPVEWSSDGIGVASRTIPVNGWHFQRAQAQLERFTRLTQCDSLTRAKVCDCGDFENKTTVLHCDHWRLCLECRGRRASRYRARFEKGRANVLKAFHSLLCDVRARWSEKFLTFTVPHSGNVTRDVQTLNVSWPLLRGSISRFMARKKLPKWREVPYWRSLEVTDSDKGHAHYHVWMLAPFLPIALVRHWWGRALPDDYRAKLPTVSLAEVLKTADKRDRAELRAAAFVDPTFAWMVRNESRRVGYARRRYGSGSAKLHEAFATFRQLKDECSLLYNGVVDVRACDGDTGRELVKYIVKDAALADDGSLVSMPAETFASIYAATDGVHTLATSAHWIVETPKPESFCPCCGAELEVRIVDSPPKATGPPMPAA